MYREKIRTCAKNIIKTEGINQLTVSKLVKECSISKRTFYEIFPTKSILIDHLIQEDNGLQIVDEREVIIRIAGELFSRQGFQNIDMDEIAKAAGLQRTTLYKYFKSKEDLLECCVERDAAMVKREAGKVLSNLEDPAATLINYITGYCSLITGPYSNTLFAVAWNQGLRNKKIEECSRDVHFFFVGSITNLLESGIEKGIFRKDLDVEGTAVVLLSALNGLEYFSNVNPSLDIKGRVKDCLLAIIFNMVLIKPEI